MIRKVATYKKEFEAPVYDEKVIVEKTRVDFMIEDNITVELKAITDATGQHLAQTLNDLEHHKPEMGLLTNSESKRLPFKRVVNSKLSESTSFKNAINPWS